MGDGNPIMKKIHENLQKSRVITSLTSQQIGHVSNHVSRFAKTNLSARVN